MLEKCQWILTADSYKQQGAKIPTLYSKWVLRGGPMLVTVKALCEGANRARAGLGLPVLEVVSECVRSEMVWEHVKLVRPA